MNKCDLGGCLGAPGSISYIYFIFFICFNISNFVHMFGHMFFILFFFIFWKLPFWGLWMDTAHYKERCWARNWYQI